MAMNPFPPQAYTRETLVKAYQWLQAQSPQLKELASTPDLLISLYQKAQLQGREALERPTLANFKNELKSLAGMMGEFETAPDAPAPDVPEMKAPSANASLQKSSAQMPTFKAGQNLQNSHAQSQMSLNLQPQGLPPLPVIPVTAHSTQTASRPQMPPNTQLPPNMPAHLAPQHISSQIPSNHASQTIAPPTPQQMPLTAQPPTQQQTSQPISQQQQPQPQSPTPSAGSYASTSNTQNQETPALNNHYFVPTAGRAPEPNQVTTTSTNSLVVTNPRGNLPALQTQAISINDESLAQLQTIMREMNLSSTDEALKLALTIGFGRLAELFPQRGPKRS